MTFFEIGKIYNRRTDIHGEYGGQQYGGISTPAGHPFIFIFTSDGGETYGYHNDYGSDDTFWYTGEGQVGNMEMSKGNIAIRDHVANNKQILLFESVTTGQIRFVGNCEYITHHNEDRPDKNGDIRSAIIFHLNIEQKSSNEISEPVEGYDCEKKPTKDMSLKNLRELALRPTSKTLIIKQKITNIKNRSKAINLYAKTRANGFCEGCESAAPFKSKEGPYLEVHHMLRLADGGPDHPENVIALCPTCHRRVHYAIDAKQYNDEMITKITVKESVII